MPKGYVFGKKRREPPQEIGWDIIFDSRPANALYWSTKEEAEAECRQLDASRIQIIASGGEIHICNNFQVEQRTSDEFIVFCEAPFISKTAIPAQKP
jgi:hypothetical protein